MDKLHPSYFSIISNFYLENPLNPILENINFWLENYNSKKNILFVKHFEPSTGGVGINLQQIITSTNQYNFYVFSPLADGNILLSSWQFGEETGTWKFKINKKSIFDTTDREIEDLFKKIVVYFNINLVHFQHLRNLPLTLIKIPKQLNIPSIFSLHDYFLLSSTPDLQTIDKSPQSPFFNKPETYIKHIKKQSKLSKKAEAEVIRFKRIAKLLNNINISVAPSNFVRDQFKKILPTLNTVLIEHGTDLPKNRDKVFQPKEKLTIAFLGAGALNKGIVDFIKLSQERRLKGKFIWKIVGGVDYKLIDERRLSQTLNILKQTGPYELKKLPEILKKEDVDLVIIMSMVAETYSYTLSDSVQSNIPVIARDIGALGERVKKLNAGWTFNNLKEAVKLLADLYHNQNLIFFKQKMLQNKEIYQSSEMTYLYSKLYLKLMSKYKKNYRIINSRIEDNRFFYSNMVQKRNYQHTGYLFSQVKMFIRSIPIVGSPTLVFARKIKTRLLQT